MKSGLSFLVAARQCEIEVLEQLGRSVELVGAIGSLVHALQRERGLSNGWLGSGGQRFAQELDGQTAQSDEQEGHLRNALAHLIESPHGAPGARLCNRVAWALAGLDALPALRRSIRAQGLSAERATSAYVKLIGALLGVVFEAADEASDPALSRPLVALFNLMQGKEFAGQERACGALAFASGVNDLARQQHWLHLIDSQEQCFRIVAEFASPALLQLWKASLDEAPTAELERLRRIACAALPGATLDGEQSAVWFEVCSQRINAMRRTEVELMRELLTLSQDRLVQARHELQTQHALLARLPGAPAHTPEDFFDRAPLMPTAIGGARSYGVQLQRSILDLVQEQAQRIQAVNDELQTARASLNERKLVERAKGLLMAHRRLSEEDAHKMLRQTAMNQNRRLVDVAESVLAMSEFLPTNEAR
ncbi:nitrate- and nitrite sensing domain-containing protein [Variovorax dokdonensis]|uniref:Nitrate- and nitrite sensing domain-containing protein n=1 Tax=Variovorax dokdonensis TaxID=344883 RepID=A0ABT7NER2_9BURK|nr:nitrate regulatory protein [Variovorax dokdonensis]MDM0046440.1 nitrate- and nitrite sensing domain-containing protein [Variovorax dokdonensis]